LLFFIGVKEVVGVKLLYGIIDRTLVVLHAKCMTGVKVGPVGEYHVGTESFKYRFFAICKLKTVGLRAVIGVLIGRIAE
jgi:hypothetical protein